jgi:hypothetical protein
MVIFALIFLLIYLLLPLLIIGLIVYFVILAIRIRGRIKKRVKEKDWYLQLSLSKEETVSHFFFLFSVFFLGLTLLALNKDLGDHFSWQTILLFTSIAGVIIGYYFKVIYTLAVSLVGFTAWWGVQATEWAKSKDIKDSVLFTGLLLIAIIFYLLGRTHEKEIKFKRLSLLYSILGLIPITGALFFLSTKSGLKILEEITKGASLFNSWEITFFLFAFIAFIIGLLIYTLNKKLIFKQEASIICLLTLLFVIIALLPEQTIFFRDVDLSKIGIFWATVLNILVLIETFGLVVLGYLRKENWLRKLGLLGIGILFLAKFIEWSNLGNNISLKLMGVIIFLNCGLLIYLLSKFLEKSVNPQLEDKIYSILGATPLTFLLFFLSSELGLRDFDFDIKSLPLFSYLLILTAIYLLLNLILYILYIYCFRNKINLLKEMSFSLVFIFLLTLIIFIFPHKNLFIEYNNISGLGIFWAIVFNIILFLEIVGILFLGYLNKKDLFINLSAVFISIFIFVKYFEWFLSFLDIGTFFIIAGILLFVVGWSMEKGRRYLLSSIKKEGVSQNQ